MSNRDVKQKLSRSGRNRPLKTNSRLRRPKRGGWSESIISMHTEVEANSVLGMRLNVKKMSFAKNKKPLMRDSRRWRSRSNKVKSRSKRKSVGGRLRKKKRKRRKLSLQLIVQRSKQPKNKSVGFNYN